MYLDQRVYTLSTLRAARGEWDALMCRGSD
jgi:hypothetical protein